MLAFVLALMLMGMTIMTVVTFLGWVLKEHRTAKKYRELVQLAELMPKASAHNTGGPQWSITFKEGRKQRTVTVAGKTEAEAIKEFTKTYSVGYGNIISSVQC